METKRGALAHKKLMRNLNQQSGAITRLRIAAAGSPMSEVNENLDALQDYVVALLAAYIRNKTKTAGISLIRRII